MTPQEVKEFWSEKGKKAIALGNKVHTIAENIINDGSYWINTFGTASSKGLHILPFHYYSPISTPEEISQNVPGKFFSDSFGVKMDSPKQRHVLNSIVSRHSEELKQISLNKEEEGVFHWKNGTFELLDGACYYSMIREFCPETVLEVGAGYSTLIASMAAAKNDNTKVTCIEPYPVEHFNTHLLSGGGFTLIEERIQDVDIDKFRRLKENDILFIDSSHVAKPGSDVEKIIFEILPVLQKGVLVHFHDMFFPYRYPKHFYVDHMRFWNENYILPAFLSGNKEWEIIISNSHIQRETEKKDKEEFLNACFGEEFNTEHEDLFYGGSLWLRKI